jgi:hypothetical protein
VGYHLLLATKTTQNKISFANEQKFKRKAWRDGAVIPAVISLLLDETQNFLYRVRVLKTKTKSFMWL